MKKECQIKGKLLVLLAIFVFGTAGAANALVIDWVDWVSADTGIANGTLAGGTVDVTFRGSYAFFQNGETGNMTNYWSEGTPAPYTGNSVVDNAPTAAEGIALSGAGEKTLTFSQAVSNPVFAFNSWNGTRTQSMQFNTGITILSTGRGYWGAGTIELLSGGQGWVTMSGEPHGVLQLMGDFTAITFTDTHNEYWHGFTMGIEGVSNNNNPDPVPEPATMALMGLGLIALAAGYRRKAKRA